MRDSIIAPKHADLVRRLDILEAAPTSERRERKAGLAALRRERLEELAKERREREAGLAALRRERLEEHAKLSQLS